MPLNRVIKRKFNLEQIFLHEYDDLKGSAVPEGHQVVDLLFFPALLLQRVTDDVGSALEARIEMKSHICPRLHAAPAGQVNLKPARQFTDSHCLTGCGYNSNVILTYSRVFQQISTVFFLLYGC